MFIRFFAYHFFLQPFFHWPLNVSAQSRFSFQIILFNCLSTCLICFFSKGHLLFLGHKIFISSPYPTWLLYILCLITFTDLILLPVSAHSHSTMLYFPTGERWRQSVPMFGFMWAMFLGTLSIGILWDLGWDCILLENISFVPPSWLYKHSRSTLIKILLFQFCRYREYNFIQKAMWGPSCTYKFSSEISYHSLPA